MTSDRLALLIASAALTLHVGAIIWTIQSRSKAALLLANIIVAIGVLAFNQLSGRPIFAPVLDVQVLSLIAFELATIATAIFAHLGWSVAQWASVIPFSVHTIASVLALLFFASFRITRLI